ncbi:MAG: hypothetical protein R2695_11255 [Acidimicrobiales bacterium]
MHGVDLDACCDEHVAARYAWHQRRHERPHQRPWHEMVAELF